MTMNILIIGATSTIAEAVARNYAKKNARFFLVARQADKLATVSADLLARGASSVNTFIMDARETEKVASMLDSAWKVYSDFDLALVAHGTLPDQKRTETDILYAANEFRINSESVIVYLGALAQRFETQGRGTIAVIGSIAGDRGRASNYLYGAAKAAIETFTSGLRARLSRAGVNVLLIKPGFVATAMTAELDLPARLTATPDHVAQDISRAITRNKEILYTPWFWRGIMLLIRHIPNRIFKKLKI